MVAPITPFKGPRHDLLVAQPGDPAPGSVLTWSVPDKTIVEVRAVSIRLVTSVVAANRILSCLAYTSAFVEFGRSPALVVQTANFDWWYHFSVGILHVDNSVNNELYQPLASRVELDNGESLMIGVTSMLPADQLSGCVIRYWGWQQG